MTSAQHWFNIGWICRVCWVEHIILYIGSLFRVCIMSIFGGLYVYITCLYSKLYYSKLFTSGEVRPKLFNPAPPPPPRRLNVGSLSSC